MLEIDQVRRDIKSLRKRLHQHLMTATVEDNEKYVRFGMFDITGTVNICQTLVMIMDSDRQNAFCPCLTDYIFIKHLLDIGRCWHTVMAFR